jgi:hypothetical protein
MCAVLAPALEVSSRMITSPTRMSEAEVTRLNRSVRPAQL